MDGSIGVFSDFYGINNENVRARYPSSLLRFNANVNFHFSDYFTVPVELSISNQETLFDAPNLPKEGIIDFISNPKNNVAIKPTYKWIQGYLGTHITEYSNLTTGDVNIFGVGVDINPGKFIFSANYGTSQRAVPTNKALFIPGVFEQKILAFRIGYGKINGTKFTLNFVKVKDDENSIDASSTSITPVEGITVSPLLEFKIGNKFFVKTETAGSIFTSDITNTNTFDDELVDKVSNFITVNASSRADFSHNTSLNYKSTSFSIGGEVLYLGAGFVPAGYRYIENDLIDYKLNTKFKLFKKSTTFRSSVGIRKNNISNTKAQTSNRFIINTSIFSRVTNNFSFNVNYSNFNFKSNNSLNELYRIETVNSTFSLSPTYTFKTNSTTHQLGLATSLNNFKRLDVVSNNFVNVRNKNINLNHSVSFLAYPLNITSNLGINTSKMPNTSLNIKNVGTRISYMFFNRKMRPFIGINYLSINRDNDISDSRFTSRLGLKYKITKGLTFNANYQLNNYNYDKKTINKENFSENRLRFSLVQNF